MKEKYGVQKYQYVNESVNPLTDPGGGGIGTQLKKTKYAYYEFEWYDTLEEAIKNADGEPIIKSVAYGVKEI